MPSQKEVPKTANAPMVITSTRIRARLVAFSAKRVTSEFLKAIVVEAQFPQKTSSRQLVVDDAM